MNREIKFRAFWRDTLKPILDFNDGFIIDTCNDDTLIVNQFINSKDQDGVEVYEGDILQAPSGSLFVVKWNDEKMRWSMWQNDTWYNMNMGLHRVVGNIYENPELIDK